MNTTHHPEKSTEGIGRNKKQAERQDAQGQFAAGHAKPNDGGLASSNPTVISGDGDATFKGDPHVDKAAPEKNEP